MSNTKLGLEKELKLTKAQSSKLDCLCGLCDHDCFDKACAFNKIMDNLHPEKVQREMILKWVVDVVKHNIEKSTRATMKKKK